MLLMIVTKVKVSPGVGVSSGLQGCISMLQVHHRCHQSPSFHHHRHCQRWTGKNLTWLRTRWHQSGSVSAGQSVHKGDPDNDNLLFLLITSSSLHDSLPFFDHHDPVCCHDHHLPSQTWARLWFGWLANIRKLKDYDGCHVRSIVLLIFLYWPTIVIWMVDRCGGAPCSEQTCHCPWGFSGPTCQQAVHLDRDVRVLMETIHVVDSEKC